MLSVEYIEQNEYKVTRLLNIGAFYKECKSIVDAVLLVIMNPNLPMLNIILCIKQKSLSI